MTSHQVRGAVMGIDYGSVRCGVAVSDPLRIIAGSGRVLSNDGGLLRAIAAMVKEEGIACIVVGMPFGPDGGTGGKAAEVRAFITRLEEAVPVPIEIWDESGSSVEAAAALASAGMKRSRLRRKGSVDAMAARVILQDYLDHHNPGRP